MDTNNLLAYAASLFTIAFLGFSGIYLGTEYNIVDKCLDNKDRNTVLCERIMESKYPIKERLDEKFAN